MDRNGEFHYFHCGEKYHWAEAYHELEDKHCVQIHATTRIDKEEE